MGFLGYISFVNFSIQVTGLRGLVSSYMPSDRFIPPPGDKYFLLVETTLLSPSRVENKLKSLYLLVITTIAIVLTRQ